MSKHPKSWIDGQIYFLNGISCHFKSNFKIMFLCYFFLKLFVTAIYTYFPTVFVFYYCKLSKSQQRGERRAGWRKRVFVGTCWNAAAAFLVHHQPLKGDHHHYHHCHHHHHHQHYYHHCHHHCRLDWRATLLHRFWSISNTPPTESQPLEVGIIIETFCFVSFLPLFAPTITAVHNVPAVK